MKAITISILTAAASAVLMTSASAAPLSASSALSGASATGNSNIQQVRMVCNENGRCWRERSERRVIIRERDAYEPRERYIDRRDRDYGDRDGVGIRAPGVSVGIGRY